MELINKVLILTNSASGFYSFRKELVQELIRNNTEVTISVPYDDRVKKLESIGANVIDTKIDRRGTNLKADIELFNAYRGIIKKIRPDVVLTYTVKPNIYGSLAARFARVNYIANITGLGSAINNGGVIRKVLFKLYTLALHKASCVFFQNEANKNEILKNGVVKHNRWRMIPGSGVNLDEFTPENYPNTKTIRFLYISRIMKDKGIEEFLYAAQKLKKEYENVDFDICGSCEEDYASEINELQERKIISYHGHLNNIKEMYSKCHCMVNPSYHEGMSNVLLEAAATARPLIASNIPGCSEIVDNSVSGFLFTAKDKNSLYQSMNKFMKLSYDQRKKMGLEARKKVERDFDRQIVIKSYIEVIYK